MPGLKDLAPRLKRRAEQITDNASNAVKQTALTIHREVVNTTPVDTGTARANWVLSMNESGGEARISNNTPYINELNRGSSMQAPASFVEQSIQAGVAVVHRKKLLDAS